MRLNKILFSAIFILAFLICAGNKTNETIKVITFNIRYDNANDGINAWTNRKNLVIEFLKEEKPDLFGLQEALWHQYTAIDSAMEGWSSIGVGRDDGKRKGEMNPLFFNDKRFKMIRSNTFWLSETPDIPGSKGWGANLPRIVTWVELKEIKTGKTLYYFNTHFAHDSDSARVMSAALLLDQVKKIAGNEKFIITGDFNMRPDSRAYYILTGAGKGNPLLVDSYKISQSAPEGPTGSSNGWSDASRGNRIDYIFVRNGMKVNSIKTVVRKQGNVFISDHWPVVAEISLE
ncbi:MAG TPA: endonuclease/exonuclease/phosphatase family protein [Bacteroidales bacterium]|nr:endonuclease/exonuclease/phosphatase family protein [Bacteroidales bacterium]HCI55968.1 endonuclease/exonuclease/phosphatase [Bacteroidales bacterium]HRC89541.1 endonuclease/exonuclease/phosphatase family protein [Bacteroidales bacterium]